MTLAARVHEKLSGKKNGIHAVEVVAGILLQLSFSPADFAQRTAVHALRGPSKPLRCVQRGS